MVGVLKINLREYNRTIKMVEKFTNQGKQVLVFNSNSVKTMIVDAKA